VIRALGLPCPNRGSANQPGAGTDGRPSGRISGSGADGCASRGAHSGTDDRAGGRAARGRLTGCRAGLLRRPLTADGIVDLELFECLRAAWQDHHARAARYRGTRAEHQRERRDGEEASPQCWALAGTFTQGSAQF
jgi:hypothetical protein